MSDAVVVKKEGPVVRMTLRRPPLNILTTEMMRAITATLDSVARDEDVRLVRLDAEGKVFSAGADVVEHTGDALEPMMKALDELFSAFSRTNVPTLAVVHGAALGGGCELALGTDLCLASERASFGLPEIRLGVFAPPASVLLPRIVGERRALGLLLSGETIPARDAERMGVVNQVFPAESFAADADDWITRLLELSGAAQRHAKRAVLAARGKRFEEAHHDLIRLYLEELMQTKDANEGLQAFLEKRTPAWTHR